MWPKFLDLANIFSISNPHKDFPFKISGSETEFVSTIKHLTKQKL